jgi:hypothetical protein
VADNLEEASENIAAVSNLCRGKELSCDTKNCVRSADHLATHYSFESATALLAEKIHKAKIWRIRRRIRRRKRKKVEKKQPENRIFQ